jgi:hypothetical protein
LHWRFRGGSSIDGIGFDDVNRALPIRAPRCAHPLTAARRTAMSLTLAAAAAAAGVNKTTLLRAIKAGKVSGNKDEHGEWHIDPPNSIASTHP